MPQTPRWTRRPPGSNWGDFGADDQLGRLNLLTPAKVMQGIAEVREGLAFPLSLPLDFPGGTAMNPRRHPPHLSPTQRNGRPNMVYPLSRDDPRLTDVVCDDTVALTLQYSTQWDALSHFGQEFDADGDGRMELVFYNGFRAGEDIRGPIDYREGAERPVEGPHGAHALGIENVATSCMQGRGVMVDLSAHFGEKRTLVGYKELMRVFEADRISVEAGDIACFRTGAAGRLLEMDRCPDPDVFRNSFAVLDGRDERLLQWITDSDVVALVADNQAVEALPARPAEGDRVTSLPLHEHCLFKLGVYLGEYWFLDELADWLRANARSRFLLTAPPSRLPRAVGSPVMPVGTV